MYVQYLDVQETTIGYIYNYICVRGLYILYMVMGVWNMLEYMLTYLEQMDIIEPRLVLPFEDYVLVLILGVIPTYIESSPLPYVYHTLYYVSRLPLLSLLSCVV